MEDTIKVKFMEAGINKIRSKQNNALDNWITFFFHFNYWLKHNLMLERTGPDKDEK